MLKQNDAVRKLLNVDVWHKAGYTGKSVTIVLLDGEGKARDNMKSFYIDVFGKQKEVGHATNVGFSAHEFGPGITVKMFDAKRDFDEAFEWIRYHKDEVDLINVSLAGISGMTTPQYLKYEELGIPLICASGNDDYEDKISYPARYPFTIAIGATLRNGSTIAGYSNEGDLLDAVVPSGVYVQRDDGYVWSVNGTSFAAPTACGMLACYIQWRKENDLSKIMPEEVRKFIHDNCRDIKDEGYDTMSGHGLFCLPETIPKIEPIPEPIKEEVVTMPKIYVSPSTQETNKGLSPFSNEEKEMNGIADNFMPLLLKDGRFEVRRNKPSMTPYQCADDSNDFKADIHIPIHSNAGGAEGTEVFAYGPNTNSERLAKALYDQIAPLSPGADRGVKFNKGLIEVGDSVKATSALIELAFHDNKTDATWLAYNHEMIAQRLYKGVCDYFGYNYKALVVTPPVAPPVIPTIDKTALAIAHLEQAIILLKG